MVLTWYTVLGVWVSVWGVLYLLSHYSTTLAFVSLGLVAAHFTDFIMKGLQNSKRRKNVTMVSNKAVFITGCDTGFGFDLASTLANMGFKVYAGCLDPEGPGSTALKLISPRIVVIPCDVTKASQVTQAYQLVEDDLETGETLWAVVNNAGIASFTEIEWCSLNTYRKLLEVNALGPVMVTKTFLPLLRQSGGGRVVIVASLAGRYTFPGFSGYSMSKHAAVSFADGLRLEMKKWNISVHTVEPTLYKTPISNIDNLQKSLDQYWEECPSEVRKSYGVEYLNEFKTTVVNHMSKAKPSEKVVEVILDLVDAVAGEEPKSRYVPGVETQIKSRLLSSLPVDIRDGLFLKGQPMTPPAMIAGRKKKPSLVDPRRPKYQGRMTRHFSVPNYEKSSETPPPSTLAAGTQFSFDKIDEMLNE